MAMLAVVSRETQLTLNDIDISRILNGLVRCTVDVYKLGHM